MWFKQTRLFQLSKSFRTTPEELTEKLDKFVFRPCRPAMFESAGWVSPLDEENMPLFQLLNGYIMLCLQIEEKILPAVVIRQELSKKIKEVEKLEDRKIRQKEKLTLKDEITTTLLPRAFSRLTRVYCYIDTKNNWLVLGTNNEKKSEKIISLFKKTFESEIHAFEIKKLSTTMTQWLKNQNYPNNFAIERACMLQDPNKENRIIRCQEQDLFANCIQSLLKEGCEVKQLALSWHDRVNVTLSDDFSLSAIKFNDDVTSQTEDIEAEAAHQKFNADFYIMSETLSKLLRDLLDMCTEEAVPIAKTA